MASNIPKLVPIAVVLSFFLASSVSWGEADLTQPMDVKSDVAKDNVSSAGTTSTDGRHESPMKVLLSNTEINWQVMSSGATDGSSTTYGLMGTLGQTATDRGSSASYGLSSGFWQEFLVGGVDCVPGDTDESGAVDIDDVVYLIAYIFSGGPAPLPNVCCGDADASGAVDIDDVVWLIAYIFSGGPPPEDGC